MAETLIPVPVFHPRDVQLDQLRAREQELEAKRGELTRLFASGLASKKKEVIAVRTYDLPTFINQFLDGALPTDQPDNTSIHILAPTNNFFFVQPIPGHPYWRNKDSVYSTGDFRTQVRAAAKNFSDVSFKSLFNENIVPVLDDDWLDQLIKLRTDNDPDFHRNLLYHAFTEELAESLRPPYPTTFRIDWLMPFRGPADKIFPYLLKNGIDKRKVLEYLTQVARERRNIVVGFNKQALQGNWLSETGEGKHSNYYGDITYEPQVAIQTDGKAIDLSLNPISAIEIGEEDYAGEYPGNFEREMLKELHILQ